LRALVFLAREEINARTELAIPTLENAEREAKRFIPSQELSILFNKLNAIVEANPEVFRMARQLMEMEKANNVLSKSQNTLK